jgi:hypothetical protein
MLLLVTNSGFQGCVGGRVVVLKEPEECASNTSENSLSDFIFIYDKVCALLQTAFVNASCLELMCWKDKELTRVMFFA